MWWKALIGPVGGILDKLVDRIPDKNEATRLKHEAEMEILETVQDAVKGQIEINKVEAAHKSIFVAGWRPSIGWCCSISIAYSFILAPVITWLGPVFAPDLPPPPVLDTDQLFQLVLAMLGMGGLRTFEKMKGVAREK
jgi:hypothetical protein